MTSQLETMHEEKKEISPEEQAQVIEFLSELERLRESNPTEFRKRLGEMGLDSGDTAGIDSFESLANSIKSMKTHSEDSSIPVQLPGGKGTLGDKGVEPKLKGITITPMPDFTIKTKRISDNMKVFINICTHDTLQSPGLKKKLDEQGKEIEGMNIPMSVGPIKHSTDKREKLCVVYDVIVNPKVTLEAKEDMTGSYRDFVCQLALQALEQKYNMNLDRKYKLPKLKYQGKEVTSQYIQDRSHTPVIEEVQRDRESARTEAMKRERERERQLVEAREKAQMAEEVDLPFLLCWSTTPAASSVRLHQEYGGPSTSWEEGSDYPMEDSPTPNTYIEPLCMPERDVCGIALLITLSSPPAVREIQLAISPYKVQLKLPAYHNLILYFPCCVLPDTTTCVLTPPPGAVRTVTLRICVDVDHRPWESCGADAGSKAWRVTQALCGESLYSSSYTDISEREREKERERERENIVEDDVFHVRPKGETADSYRSLVEEEEEELPEDRFHKKDASSNYILSQREKEVNEKREKHAKEKEERKNDPNVEYVDAEDYKPGGKHGSSLAYADIIDKPSFSPSLSSSSSPPSIETETVVESKAGDRREILQAAAGIVKNSTQILLGTEEKLSSTLWSELLE